MAIKFTKIDDKEIKGQKVERKTPKSKEAVAKRIQKNADISATKSAERPKVTLPKFSWDKDK